MTKGNSLCFTLLSHTEARVIVDWLMKVQGYPYYFIKDNLMKKYRHSADIPVTLATICVHVYNNRVHVYGAAALDRLVAEESCLSFADFEELFSDVTERLPGVAFLGYYAISG